MSEEEIDLFAIETIPGIKEARVLLRLLKKYKTPGYISFTCRDQCTNAGERLKCYLSNTVNIIKAFPISYQ